MHLPVGTILRGGRYEILRYISSGGFGCTYEARDTAFRNKVKTVAIKEFFVKDFCNRDTVTGNVVVATQSKKELIDKLRGKFMDEAEALYEFQHPNIVRVTDKFEENDTAYYVMDFIDGRSLNAIVEEKGCLSDPEAVGYIRQIADALKYVHDNNCLHLDVKPGNIMIDSHGKAVLIDFGVSKQYDEVKGENTSTLMGYTPGYAPLEQSGNGVVKFSPATDIYSLGATLFKILTGITPPVASEVNENGLPAFPDGTSYPVRRAIEASMQPRRKDRPQNIDEFLVLLDGDEVELIATDNDVAEMEGCCAMPEDNGSGAVVLPIPDNVYIDDDVHVEEVVPVRPRKNRKTVFLLLFVLVAVSAVLVINHLGSNGASSEVVLSDEPKVFVSGNMDQEELQPDSVDMHDDVEDINEIESVVSVEAITASEAFDKGKAEYDKGNFEEAVKWFRKSADQGNAKAQKNLGLCYDKGEGVDQSYEEAVKWYRKAADQGNAKAQFNLGNCYDKGEGVDQSYEEAVKWYRKAADQGDAKAQCNLGLCYYNGEGVDQSYEEAVKWWRLAADQGHARAQCNLGLCYTDGEGVDQSYEEAVKWWRLAADQGLAGAQYNLGVCYYNGRGVPQSYEEAAKWYRKAADQGDADAKTALGLCYADDEGVPQSNAEAVKWSVAAQNAKVTGKVTDTNGEAVIGASVIVIGTNLGASTDIEGNFTIENVPNSATTIRVSYVGMATQEVHIVRGKAMKVVLIED